MNQFRTRTHCSKNYLLLLHMELTLTLAFSPHKARTIVYKIFLIARSMVSSLHHPVEMV